MNPCPCGHDGDPAGLCRCRPERIARYLDRLSGPFLDRLDMAVDVPRPESLPLPAAMDQAGAGPDPGECIAECRQRQWRRSGCLNGDLHGARLQQVCRADGAAQRLLEELMRTRSLSGRGVHRLLRTARTIADLEGVRLIGENHLAEAVVCRNLARFPLAGARPPAPQDGQ